MNIMLNLEKVFISCLSPHIWCWNPGVIILGVITEILREKDDNRSHWKHRLTDWGTERTTYKRTTH